MPTPIDTDSRQIPLDESIPLLGGQPTNKPFYRARPLWLVPFAITASLVRGMTLAPRVQVFTQLSCNRLHGSHNWNHTQTHAAPSHISLYTSIDPLGPQLHTSALFPETSLIFPPNFTAHRDVGTDIEVQPSSPCRTDPAVQSGAARLQTMMTTTMGLLSAFTTGWWGHFGERHGRTKVLAVATFGLFMTDLTFILVSTPSSPFSKYGPNLLLLAPVVEGLLGGWSTLQSATSAYLSDCTSPGSRAQIFSRFTGVFYLGFAVGPSIGAWLIQHPFSTPLEEKSDKLVTTVFWVAIFFSMINFILVLFVFPESLDKKRMENASKGKGKAKVPSSTGDAEEEDEEEDRSGFPVSSSSVIQGGHGPQGRGRNEGKTGLITGFLRPLAVFLPVVVLVPSPNGLGRRKKRDWSLTLLAVALLGFMLSSGLYQIKYLYAVHTYSWGAEQLSYYISFMGGGRAVFLLFVLPSLIKYFKPKPVAQTTQVVVDYGYTNGKKVSSGLDPAAPIVRKGKKPKPTRAQLGQEIKFDLRLAKCSLMMEMISHSLVAILPSPSLGLNRVQNLGDSNDFKRSQAMFVAASSLTGLGSGAVPAIHSLALCMMQVRALDAKAAAAGQQEVDSQDGEGTGALFGALAVLQAVGQMILGPMLFGVIYSGTVATFPKTIFVVGAGLMMLALTVMLCVRNPVRRRVRNEMERGRSRVSKDLRRL